MEALFTTLLALLFGAAAATKLLNMSYSIAIRDRLGISARSWYWIGFLELAGSVGVLVGLAIPELGVAAAIGLAFLSIGAIAAHLRAGDGPRGAAGATIALLLAVATAALQAGSI